MPLAGSPFLGIHPSPEATGSTGRHTECLEKSSAAPPAPPEGAEEVIGFFPALIALACPAVTSSRCRRAARLCQAATSRLEAPARRTGSFPGGAAPLRPLAQLQLGPWPPVNLSCPGLRAVARALCVPQGHGEPGQGVAGASARRQHRTGRAAR